MYKYCVIISCLAAHQLVSKFSPYFIEIEWWQSFHYISAALHLTIFGIWSNNMQYVQYVICVMIVREVWYIGLAIRYTIWIVSHLCTLRGTFLRINGKTTLSLLIRPPRVAGGTPAVNHKATAIWLALRVLAGNEHCNMCYGNPFSEYIFNFFMATYEWMHPKYDCHICK